MGGSFPYKKISRIESKTMAQLNTFPMTSRPCTLIRPGLCLVFSYTFILLLAFLLPGRQAAAAALTGSAAASPASINLTATGTADWVHWGLNNTNVNTISTSAGDSRCQFGNITSTQKKPKTAPVAVNRKAGVSPGIANYAYLGSAPCSYEAPIGTRAAYIWSDGTPTASGNTTAGAFFNGAGNGFTLSLPADTTTRTLQLYVGGWLARGELRATLSDGSAAPYVTVIDNPKKSLTDRLVTITYSAAKAGQTLTVRYVLLRDYGSGYVMLSAAALSKVPLPNQPPVAVDDAVSGDEDTVLTGNVLTNDRDPDNGPAPLSVQSNTTPTQGRVSLNADGRFSYTPNADYNGIDSFSYTITDGAATASATVKLTIGPVNDAPIAVNGTLTTAQGTAASGTLGASDIDGDSLSIRITTNGAKGTARITDTRTGAYTYTPASGAAGEDTFTFKANDGVVDSNAATVTVTNIRSPIGALTGSATASPGTVNLTTTGTADWIHWGLSGASSINRKVGVNPGIGNYTSLGAAPARFEAPSGARVGYSWSDGAPNASGNTRAGLFFNGIGNGATLELPADTTTRTLQLYVGGWTARAELRATLSDGSAAPYVAVIDSPNGVIDRQVTITYSAATAGQTLTVRYVLLDNYGIGNVTLSAAALVGEPGSPNGALTGSATASPGTVNLTTTGTADWIHWGLSGASSINRKVGVNPGIGNYTSLGAAPARFEAPSGARVGYSWSDGAPNASGNTRAGLFFNGIGNGATLELPADTTTRTLQLYVGGWTARAELRATLSDGSAAPYVAVIDSPNGVIDRQVTITYSAATAGQTLTVRYVLLDNYGIGNVTLSAAALVVYGNSPPFARPDSFTLRANSTNSYFDVLTNDRDPDPADRFSIIVANAPDQGGTAHIVNGGSAISYTPPAGFTGLERFSYVVADGAGARAMALVSVTVVPQMVPNIIVILADDLGYQDIGAFGAPDIATPNLDRMAQEGVRFTAFYAHVTCGPSRAALMTGSYAPRANLSCTQVTNSSTGISPNEITVAELLRDSGYATKIIGKWHLGDHPQFLPTKQGFTEFYGFPYSHDMWPFHPLTCPSANEDPRLVAARQRAAITGTEIYAPGFCLALGEFPDLPLYSNQNIVAVNPDPGSLTQRFTQSAVQFIEQNRNGPFFLYLPYTAPHVPLKASAAFRGTSSRGLYGDVVQELDWGVGQVLDSLKRLGIDQNTLVIFTSDNGPWREYGIDGGSAGPLRGGKKTAWEGGVRVPTIMRWPGSIPAGTATSRVGHLADLLPTLSGFGGAALPTDRVLDGANIWPLMIGQSGVNSPHEFLMYYLDDPALKFGDQSKNLRAIRWGKWKLFVTMNGVDVVAEALYDLETDIGETTNVMSANPGVSAVMVAMAQNNNDELRAHNRPLGVLNKTIPELFGSTHVPAEGPVTLSSASVLDWAHWGYSSTSVFNHKANVSQPISDVSAIGQAQITVASAATDVTRGMYSWSDGTPLSTVTNTDGYIQTTGTPGAGFEIRLPADADSRTLRIYLGVSRARGRLEASLSDNSAPPFVTFVDNPGAADNRIARFNYRAAANGAQLIIRYVIDDNYASTNGTPGGISLSAMTVTRNP